MKLHEIKEALSRGKTVRWTNENYEVVKDSLGHYLVHCVVNNTYVGLTHKHGYLIEDDKQFFIKK